MRADGEGILLKNGSKQANLWGINLYLQEVGDEWIEYDSLNLRPSQGMTLAELTIQKSKAVSEKS